MHKRDLERGILTQRPTLDITRSNWCQVRVQVDKVRFHFTQSAVRGSPLAVIMGLVSTQGQHIPCRELQVLCPVMCLLAEDSYQSREEPEVVSRSEPRTPRRFFHFSETMRDMLVLEHGS
jgi:hypothetical protein